eukprot:GILI01023968.1.p1 GENE.GILI01023968.1~~GILI01023968.1.p1  ORF type:complete len:272 (+),score=34.62 GILI01023968.1:35-850(+)
MPQYAPARYTADGRLRAPLHLLGPARNRKRLAFGPGFFLFCVAAATGKYYYEKFSVVTPQQHFMRSIKIVPYGVLGTTLSLQGSMQESAPLPNEGTAITDPAGLHHIRATPEGAGGASGAIYNWLGLKKSFPEDVRRGINRMGDAKYHDYNGKKVIHVVGPDFREGKWSEREATIELARAYRNLLHEFVLSEADTLRIAPVSGGIFSGPLYDQIPPMTQQALSSGFEQLHVYDKDTLTGGKGKNIELCIFMNREFDMFNKVFDSITPASKL